MKLKNFKYKDELNHIKNLHDESVFKWIVICHGKLKLCFPLDKEEYELFKKLELRHWKNDKRL